MDVQGECVFRGGNSERGFKSQMEGRAGMRPGQGASNRDLQSKVEAAEVTVKYHYKQNIKAVRGAGIYIPCHSKKGLKEKKIT